MNDRVKQALLAMQRYNWEQGVTAQAFLEAGDDDIAIALAIEGANRQNADGRCCHIADSTAVTDPCAVGEALIFAAEKTGDPFLIAAKDKLLHWALIGAPRNDAGVVYHFLDSRMIWVDSMYMLPPFLARAGEYDEAMRYLNADGEKNPREEYYAASTQVMYEDPDKDKPRLADVQVISICGVRICAFPAEMFYEYAIDLKTREKDEKIMIATIANGVLGYIPTRQAFINGGYEPSLGFTSNSEEGCGEMLVDSVVRQIAKMKEK